MNLSKSSACALLVMQIQRSYTMCKLVVFGFMLENSFCCETFNEVYSTSPIHVSWPEISQQSEVDSIL